ncbi:hypothetical protein [Sphingobacterium ginsenosidimutans]|uniref:Lipoprotein n=1 Tax=Sphingobacterium ginsenosidimutans TaxID=687845 RepID=A0ABP7ZQT3_9SPHI
MKIKLLLINVVFCISLTFFSCSNNFDKIEIPDDKIEEVESSMRFVKQTLEKSIFDTVEIAKTEIQRAIDYELQTNSRALSRDSISKEVHKNFSMDQLVPLTKNLYCDRDGSITLNERLIGKDFGDFEKNIMTCREFENMSLDDRKRFIKSVAVLMKNNIWSCWGVKYSDSKTKYYFDYSEENIYINDWKSRWLYLDSVSPGDYYIATREFRLIDKKNGISLYKLFNKN